MRGEEKGVKERRSRAVNVNEKQRKDKEKEGTRGPEEEEWKLRFPV